MKKILNNPADYVDEMLDGFVAAHPEFYAQPERRVIARPEGATSGKVGIVTGGGSGHLPVFTVMSARVSSMPAPSATCSPARPPSRWQAPSATPMAAPACSGFTETMAATS